MTVVELQAKKSEVSKYQKDYYNKIKKTTEKAPETVIVKNKAPEEKSTEFQPTNTNKGAVETPETNQQK